VPSNGVCSKCTHPIHHNGVECDKIKVNDHVSCKCFVTCQAGDAFTPSHCGKVCGKQWNIGRGYHNTAATARQCACVQCTCKKCAPEILCGCKNCGCTECTNSQFQAKFDNCWLVFRLPMAPTGLGIMIWSAIVNFGFGIVWGVLMMLSPCLCRRIPGMCKRPSKAAAAKDITGKWDAWDRVEVQRKPHFREAKVDASVVLGKLHSEGVYVNTAAVTATANNQQQQNALNVALQPSAPFAQQQQPPPAFDASAPPAFEDDDDDDDDDEDPIAKQKRLNKLAAAGGTVAANANAFCQSCGTKRMAAAAFCGGCGTKF
jgi:hypothetical protein